MGSVRRCPHLEDKAFKGEWSLAKRSKRFNIVVAQIEFCQRRAFLEVLNSIDVVTGEVQLPHFLQADGFVNLRQAVLLADQLNKAWP